MAMSRGMASVVEAINAGRIHMQRVFKGSSAQFATGWYDYAFTGGQPGYDARVGVALEFTPAIAQKNDAIFFPPVSSGSERYLLEATFRSTQSITTSSEPIIIFDLLGYYPLIDGDSADLQAMDNTVTLPRYTDGKGVKMVLVNHVAPQANAGVVVITYTDTDDVERTVTQSILALSNSLITGKTMTSSTLATTAYGTPFIELTGNAKGVKNVTSVTFTTPPGGLYALYLVKPLMNLGYCGGTGNSGVARTKNFVQNSVILPRIYDGASISFFAYRSGSNTGTTYWSEFTFIWT